MPNGLPQLSTSELDDIGIVLGAIVAALIVAYLVNRLKEGSGKSSREKELRDVKDYF